MRFVFSESMDEVRLAGQWPTGRKPLAVLGSLPPTPFSANAALVKAARWLQRAALDASADVITAVFPTDCLLCAGPITTLTRDRVCDVCLRAVRTQAEALCSRCGEALGMESARFAAALGAQECTACRLVPPAFARAAAFAGFEDNVRELIHLLKFGGHRLLAERVLGQWLALAMLAAVKGRGDTFLVVPVPMFATRQRSRGFNQAALLAGAAVRHLRKSAPALCFDLETTVLNRVRDTQALYALNPKQRRLTLKGAFRVSKAERVQGREIVLVDDIMTTGATARECARVLLRAGASAVTVATVARAQPESIGSHVAWSPNESQPGSQAGSGFGVAHWDMVEPAAVPFKEGRS